MPGRFAAALVACLAVGMAHAAVDLPRESRVPGGVAIIDLGPGAEPPGEVVFNAHRAPVLPGPKGWVTIIGIPLDTAPGAQSAEFRPIGEAEPRAGVERAEQRLALERAEHGAAQVVQFARRERRLPVP